MTRILVFILFFPLMAKSQLDEKILCKDFKRIENSDFREVLETDVDSFEIEFDFDYYYKPRNEKVYTFLNRPISGASFLLDKNRKIKEFGMWLYIEDSKLFYREMVETYGEASSASLSEYYLKQHGFKKLSEYNDLDESDFESLPLPTPENYNNTRMVSWYKKESKNTGKEVLISIYNYPEDGYDFSYPSRKLRIKISHLNMENMQ
ncbi:hypothetical protein [Ulvibacterium sp.]|uniref:hypothetical protein n=1 Tax=Ulvibacterium sp. TaxID=2665914 RepID=UPI0026388718|nr:hypothetical protein [Ulvibacterium sp.]